MGFASPQTVPHAGHDTGIKSPMVVPPPGTQSEVGGCSNCGLQARLLSGAFLHVNVPAAVTRDHLYVADLPRIYPASASTSELSPARHKNMLFVPDVIAVTGEGVVRRVYRLHREIRN